MDGEDDICILQHSSDDDVDIDGGLSPNPIIPFSPLSPRGLFDLDSGPQHALQKAYKDLKQRLNETNAENQLLIRRVQELESAKTCETIDTSFVTIGESFDMMDDVNFGSPGGMVMNHAAEAQIGAEEGFSNNLQRQLTRTKAQLQAMEQKYQNDIQERDSKLGRLNQKLQEYHSKMVALMDENKTLLQNYESERREKEAALQSLQDLREKCHGLPLEKDKAFMGNQEMAGLKDKQGDNLAYEPTPELISELATMRKVIDSLKSMVKYQRDFLTSKGFSMQSCMGRSMKDTPSVDLDISPHGSGRSGGSHSGHSWEMVNGTALSPADSRPQQQHLLQQRSSKASSMEGSSRPDYSGAARVNGRGDAGMESSPSSQQRLGLVRQKSKTDVIQRRRSEDDVSQPKCKTEVIRSHTLPQPQRLANWMDAHYQARDASQPVGLNQLMQEPTHLGELPEPGMTVPTRSTQSAGAQYPPSSHGGRQTSPVRDLASTYDNLTVNTSRSNTEPSMHILNQSSMTGGSVVQNSSDNFGNSGRNATIPTSQPTWATVTINRDANAMRSSSHEHPEPRPASNPTDLQLNHFQTIHVTNGPSAGQPENSQDRKCPVCGQDYSHVTMDEFQTHVFNCFDDDDSSSAPETLQPQTANQQTGQRIPKSSDRMCPMCERLFPENFSQSFFEGHVQSHFEDVVNHFEVLNNV